MSIVAAVYGGLGRQRWTMQLSVRTIRIQHWCRVAYDVNDIRSVNVVLGVFREITLFVRALRAIDVCGQVSGLVVTVCANSKPYPTTPDCMCRIACLVLFEQHDRISHGGKRPGL